jgi:hypothetical protein
MSAYAYRITENNKHDNDKKLTKVLSAKLSIQDHNICKLIVGHLFKEGILDEPTRRH